MYIYLTFKISFATHYRVALLFLNPGPAMNNLRKLLIFGLIVQVFATFLLFGSADSKTADVPYVENWKEIIYFSEDSNNDKNLENMVKVAYPLVGLIWCLIVLNEFLPLDLERRKFSNESIDEEIQIKQLAKSEDLLQKIKMKYKTSNLLLL